MPWQYRICLLKEAANMSDTVHACLITNPRSGHGGIDLIPILPILRAHGWEVVVRQKLHGGHATELAREAVRDGYDIVVNCGGDGTLSEIVDGVVGSPVAVGTIPGGTANLWAREVGISRRLDVAALQLVNAQRRRVDVGRVTVNGRHKRHFLLMAGIGFDGAVIARVSKRLKNRIGPLAVGLAALRALPTFAPVAVQVVIDGVEWQGTVTQVIVGNTRRYGGFTRMTPEAIADDGLLDLCLITAHDLREIGRQAASLLAQQRPDGQSAQLYRAASIVIRAPRALPLQVDGGAEKVKAGMRADGVTYAFSVITQGVTVLVPRISDGALFQDRVLAHHPIGLLGGPAGEHEAHGGESSSTPEAGKGYLTVLAVGADTIAAARNRDGRVRTIMLDDKTETRDAHAEPCPRDVFLAGLQRGDIIKVKGEKDKARGVVVARRVTRIDHADPSS
jgi:YegS/Rv2252/BmrU family lipid kinase